LGEPHDGPGLPAAPGRFISVALVCHFGLRKTSAGVEIDEVVGREIRAQDFVDDGIGMLSCDVDEGLVVLIVAYIVQKVKIYDCELGSMKA
jgi:hypothetical protein